MEKLGNTDKFFSFIYVYYYVNKFIYSVQLFTFEIHMVERKVSLTI